MGIVDADALPTSESPSPATPSTFPAVALVVRFGFDACLTRGMVASSVSERLVDPARKIRTPQKEVTQWFADLLTHCFTFSSFNLMNDIGIFSEQRMMSHR